MKKYTGTISFVILIALILSVFYIKNATADRNLPQFVIQKTAGNSQLKARAEGSIYLRNSASEQYVIDVDEKGIEYRKQGLSNRAFEDVRLQQLREEHSKFMRRKDIQIDSRNKFYEDKKRIGYAEDKTVDFPSINVAVLDKKSGEIIEFETKVAGLEKAADWIQIERVGLYGDEMKVIGSTDYYQDNISQQNLYLFTIDLKQKKINKVEELYSNKVEKPDEYLSMDYPRLEQIGDKGNHFVFASYTSFYDNTEQEEADEPKTKDYHYYDLDIRTGKIDEIKSALSKEKMDLGEIQDNILYALKHTKDGIKIQQYDLKEQKDLKALEVKESDGIKLGSNTQMKIENGKLLLYTTEFNIKDEGKFLPASQLNWPQVIVINPNDGKVEYAGKVLPKDTDIKKLEGFGLSIGDFYIK